MLYGTTLLAFCLACQAPQQKTSPAAEAQSVDHLSPALRIEAGRLNSLPVSPLFAALGQRKGEESAVGLPKDQLKLILEMDATARKTLRHWLTRSRPEGSPPLKFEDFVQAKAFVVGHMEAIVFECFLTPGQVAEWRKLASRPVMPAREGRYRLIPESALDGSPADTAGRCINRIYNLSSSQENWKTQGVSELFRFVLPSHLTPDWGVLPDLTAEQLDLAKRLNAIACDAVKLWLEGGISAFSWILRSTPEQWALPPTPAMRSYVSEAGRRRLASVASHAEEILLDAGLEPNQRTELKRRLWIYRGVSALLDPELSGILRLAKWQREVISVKLDERAKYRPWARGHSASAESMEFFRRTSAIGHISTPEEDELDRTLRKENDLNFERLLANFDAAIWDVLSTAQSRTLAKILRKPIPKKEAEKPRKEAEKPKKKSSRSS